MIENVDLISDSLYISIEWICKQNVNIFGGENVYSWKKYRILNVVSKCSFLSLKSNWKYADFQKLTLQSRKDPADLVMLDSFHDHNNARSWAILTGCSEYSAVFDLSVESLFAIVE